jgi:hypothetical protein
MMETVSVSETSVYLYMTTWRYIPEGCHIHIRRSENLKSHLLFVYRVITNFTCGI